MSILLSQYEDGITHINTYSKGKTELGRMLSNFAKCPITTDDGNFMSVEGYWYWMSIDNSVAEKENLRKLYGYYAKSTGIDILKRTNNGKSSRWDNDFENKILKAIWCKFQKNKHLILPEYENLPLVHYYVFNGKTVDVTRRYQWMIDGMNKMKDCLIHR